MNFYFIRDQPGRYEFLLYSRSTWPIWITLTAINLANMNYFNRDQPGQYELL